jgi:hypothetical protein
MKNKVWGSVDQKFLFVRAVVIRNREQLDTRLIEAPALVFMAKGLLGGLSIQRLGLLSDWSQNDTSRCHGAI